jgi:membrane protease YdiL (CAAX protease family)
MPRGVEFPQNELESLAWGIGTLALIVVFAPIMEEVMFRSWMSGRPGHICWPFWRWAAARWVLYAMRCGCGKSRCDHRLARNARRGGGAIYRFRQRGALGWFARAFPVFFWLSALGFATIHIWNYTEGSGPLVFLLVIPQLVAGTIFAYARVHYGLWSAIALHMLHNGTAVALALSLGEVMG